MDDTTGTRTIAIEGGLCRRTMQTYALGQGSAPLVVVDTPVFRVGSRPGNDLVLDDPAVSRAHFVIEVVETGFRLRDLESTNGTFVDGYRVGDVHLRARSVIRAGTSELVFSPTGRQSEVPSSRDERFGGLVGTSVRMRELFAVLERAAPTDSTVLIEGETGTGKEVAAHAIHQRSKRATGPFSVFDCGAVPANLIESELFGHEAGAFTGAAGRKTGRIEEANGGTLFLDELGELPVELQPKLLRALEAREIRRVGGTKTLPVDIRVLAATNRDLAREVNRGTFREDLYYRLAVIRVTLPTLRERREDIPLLVEHFVRLALRDDPDRVARILGGLSGPTLQKLMDHPWPGNVREFKNVIDRTLALSGGEQPAEFEVSEIASRLRPSASGPGPEVDLTRGFSEHRAEVLARFERAYLSRQLERHGANYSRAAAASGLDRMYFKRLLKKYR